MTANESGCLLGVMGGGEDCMTLNILETRELCVSYGWFLWYMDYVSVKLLEQMRTETGQRRLCARQTLSARMSLPPAPPPSFLQALQRPHLLKAGQALVEL